MYTEIHRYVTDLFEFNICLRFPIRENLCSSVALLLLSVGQHTSICFKRAIGHRTHTVVIMNLAQSLLSEFVSQLRIAKNPQETLAQTLRVILFNQQTTARPLDNFAECPASWLDHRHSAGHCLQ